MTPMPMSRNGRAHLAIFSKRAFDDGWRVRKWAVELTRTAIAVAVAKHVKRNFDFKSAKIGVNRLIVSRLPAELRPSQDRPANPEGLLALFPQVFGFFLEQ